ncbi:MAG: tetratricopeptide repeat protein, partial [Methanosarcina sp.]|nr:tetratricopeptide repeat protein [Methanosarcina sp.]
MSRQLVDSIDRILDNTILQFEKGQYKKALENLEKAEKLSEKVNRPDLLCQTLLFKGRALLALNRQEEALVEFQRLMELSISLFLEDSEDNRYQYFVYNSIGFTARTLGEIDDISKIKESLSRNEKYFGKTFDAFEKLIAKEPEDYDSIENYLKTLENVRGYYMRARQFENQTPIMRMILQNYERIFEVRSKKEELFDTLNKLIDEYKTYCFVFMKPDEAKEVFAQAEEVYKKVLKKEPENRLAFRGLISLYEDLGDLYS